MIEMIALVTGASRGIGKAIATHLATLGYRVIGTATTAEGAEAIQAHLSQWNGVGLVLNLDSRETLKQQGEALIAAHGAPAILINNAGVTSDSLFMRMKEEVWDKVINTNLTGTALLTQLCIKGMIKERFGRIVNIASVVASMGNVGQANYVAAKAGLIGLTKALATEVAGRGITVNAVAPGFIDTDMTDGLDEALKAHLLEKIPMKRMGQPEDIAAAVAYLVSEQAAYITGTTLHVNGGMLMV